MARNRLAENKGLPERWVFKHGAYYYRPRPSQARLWEGKTFFHLGRQLPDAYRTWADRIGTIDKIKDVNQLLDRYALEVIPTKAPKTQHENYRYLKPLRKAFGSAHPLAVKPQHIYQYVNARTGKVAARREIALLSHAFTKAVEWGDIDKHPFKGQIRLEGEEPRDRYIEDWEIDECLALKPKRKEDSVTVVQAYIKLKTLISIRQRDMLLIQPARDFTDQGIVVMASKRRRKKRKDGKERKGKITIYRWTPELREIVAEALAARPVDISPYLFCTRRGLCYVNEVKGTAKDWDALWRRFMRRVLTETKVTEHFTEHDLRAKAASDAETDEDAQKLLGHEKIETTRRVYRRKPTVVTPLKRRFL